MRSRLKDIIEIIKYKPLYITQIANYLNINYVTVWKWIKKLENEGKVETKRYANAKIVRWKG